MSKHHSFIDTIEQITADAVNKGIVHLSTEDIKLSGNKMRLKGKDVINFGSCSYLGLEFDPRLIAAAKEATDNYGTQFSASRAYVSSRHYDELEEMFEQIIGSPSIVAPTTTLGHIAAIPVLIQDEDAIILDHQVHNSVQTAVTLVKPRGVHVEMIRHNNMNMLEDRVKVLRSKYKRIWYMADGIYSMYGDCSPVNEVYELMNKYPELYYYVDDAHGMSCFGENGRGYVLSQQAMHERMIFTTSLAKAYATGGAVLSFPNKELAKKVRSCGGPFLSSGPMQPAAMGAALACAKIHLSNEIYLLHDDLQENIKYCNLMLKKYGLPNVSESNSPVFFVGVSLPKVAYNLINKMLNDGYYLNIGIFPTVPMKNTGVRFTITRLHTFIQIENMIATMAGHFPQVLEEENFSMEKIYRAFKMNSPQEQVIETLVQTAIKQSNLKVEHQTCINNINAEEWDNLLGDRGTFNWEGLKFLEESFKGNELLEDNWEFDYLIIKDQSNKPVLATFLTMSLCKDDMLSPAAISQQVEEIRATEDPYYLTSRVLSMGSSLTIGDHLYIDRTSSYWKEAMQLLFEKISELQEKYQATTTMLRDFVTMDPEMDAFLVDNGYFKISMPENSTIENINWNNREEFTEKLSPNSKKNLKRYVLKHEDKYELEVISNPKSGEVEQLYRLYLNVKENSLELNTFTIPFNLFENMARDKNWEILTLKLKPEWDLREERKPVAVMFNFVRGNCYNFMFVGLDYEFQEEFKCYKQALFQLTMRAQELGLEKINLGFTTSFEKRKMGAQTYNPIAYMQTKDNYNLEVLGTMNVLKVRNQMA